MLKTQLLIIGLQRLQFGDQTFVLSCVKVHLSMQLVNPILGIVLHDRIVVLGRLELNRETRLVHLIQENDLIASVFLILKMTRF